MRIEVILFIFSITCCYQLCNGEKGYYTIVASNLMRINKPYRVFINYKGYESDKLINIGLKASGIEEYKNETITMRGSGEQNIDFHMTGNQKGHHYELVVKTLPDNKVIQSRRIKMNAKFFSVFIQTDKSIYKPADKIQFRVLLLNAETKPINPSKVEFYITDGKNNRVKQFDGVKFTKGVYENELQLSDLPVMGKWKINVKVNRQKEIMKVFEVDEYVLPKFEFLIDVNPDANFKDNKILATVKAKYTFGKKAKGNATITAECKENDYGWNFRSSSKVGKLIELDGKKLVEFDLKKDLGIRDNRLSECEIKLFATFTEELSGKEQNASATVQAHVTPHKIRMEKSGDKFKPQLPYIISAVLQLHDKNIPVTDERNSIKFTTTFYRDVIQKCKRYRGYSSLGYSSFGSNENNEEEYACREEKSETKETKIFPKNGLAELKLEIPEDVTEISVEARYLDTVENTGRISKLESESNEYIQAKLLSKPVSLKKKISIDVLATEEMKLLSYQVIGSGTIIESKTVPVSNTKQFTLEFMPKPSMAPKSHVIVYYVASNHEIISDKIQIEIEDGLKNFIDLSLSTNEAKPGDDLNITVKSQADSFVGILGVDQSVLVLKKGNDIEKSAVMEELKKYSKVPEGQIENNKHRDFSTSDAIIITNLKSDAIEKPKLPKKNPYFGRYPIYYHDDGVSWRSMQPRIGGFGGPPGYGGFGGSSANAAASSQSFGSGNSFGGGLSLNQPVPVMSRMDTIESTGLMISEPSRPMEASKKVQPKPIEIRKVFPETWLFESFDLSSSSQKVLTKKVPDTITSWIITGFSVNPTSGLGLTSEASKLNVFQPFFVSTNLPYSIKRGEVVAIPMIVFNYMESDQEVEVTLFNTDKEFEFVEVNEEKNSVRRRRRSIDAQRKKKIFVKSNEGTTASFMIRPFKIGHITIRITAQSAVAGDGVEQKLLVEPEGVTQFMNEAVLIDLQETTEYKKTIDIVIPENAVQDSTRIEAAVVGDILGPSIENLDNLIKLPYGCGEQNMVNFVPNIVVLNYLTSVNQLTPEIEQKAKGFLESGYQRQLGYKHSNGAYSAFGNGDGVTWLTAFVAKSFNQATKYIHIDQEIIKQALNFLKKVQKPDGSFPEVGYMLSKEMQGGAANGIGLTAYVLITFLENELHVNAYKTTIEKAINNIVVNLDNANDIYSLAIASYALQLADHEAKNSFIDKLNSKASKEDGMMYWKKEESTSSNKKPNSINTEITAYALEAFTQANRNSEAILIMKWLISQRNENGGFKSTQDTVVGLQALANIAMKLQSQERNIQISLDTETKSISSNVDTENAMLFQKYELPSSSRHFEVSATGNGIGLLQIAYRYNIIEAIKFPRFTLDPKIESTSNKEYLDLTVCTKFIPDAKTKVSNMAIMEVTLPSGFTFDSDHLKELKSTRHVKKVEMKDSDTIVIIYFDRLESREVCPEIKAYRTHGVAHQKPSPIIIYDYYDNSFEARAFYNPPEISLCDICEDDECDDFCEIPSIEVS